MVIIRIFEWLTTQRRLFLLAVFKHVVLRPSLAFMLQCIIKKLLIFNTPPTNISLYFPIPLQGLSWTIGPVGFRSVRKKPGLPLDRGILLKASDRLLGPGRSAGGSTPDIIFEPDETMGVVALW